VFFVDTQETAIVAGLGKDFCAFAVGIAHIFVVFEFDEQVFMKIVDAEVFEWGGWQFGEKCLAHIGFTLGVVQSVKGVLRNGK
jgi:hypothetical protein